MKVLRRSLTDSQIARLRAEVSGAWSATEYSRKRLILWKVSGEELNATCSTGYLIEFHDKAGTRRILLRRRGLCVVLDLDKHLIITAYRNPIDDHHLTLNLTNYDEGPVDDEVLRGH